MVGGAITATARATRGAWGFLSSLIMERASTNVLRAEARKKGMRTLRETGLMAIYEGITTIEEVVKETIVEEG